MGPGRSVLSGGRLFLLHGVCQRIGVRVFKYLPLDAPQEIYPFVYDCIRRMERRALAASRPPGQPQGDMDAHAKVASSPATYSPYKLNTSTRTLSSSAPSSPKSQDVLSMLLEGSSMETATSLA